MRIAKFAPGGALNSSRSGDSGLLVPGCCYGCGVVRCSVLSSPLSTDCPAARSQLPALRQPESHTHTTLETSCCCTALLLTHAPAKSVRIESLPIRCPPAR